MQNRSKFLKAFDAFGFLTAVLVVVTWMYGLQARNWYRARGMKRSHPAVSLVPRPLSNTTVNGDKAMTLTAFGYRMDVPWARLEAREDTTAVAVYLFTGGVGLRFWNPAKTTGAVEMMKQAAQRAHRRFADFLGARTEYDFLEAELKTTPEQISPFMGKAEAFRQGLLLNMKLFELEREPYAIYSIALGNLKGFQIGDPAKDRLVELRTFDSGEREFRLLFAVERGSNVRLEQSEINGVLNSLRSTPETDPAGANAQ